MWEGLCVSVTCEAVLTRDFGSFQEVTLSNFFCDANPNAPTGPEWNRKETKKKKIFSNSDSNERGNPG